MNDSVLSKQWKQYWDSQDPSPNTPANWRVPPTGHRHWIKTVHKSFCSPSIFSKATVGPVKLIYGQSDGWLLSPLLGNCSSWSNPVKVQNPLLLLVWVLLDISNPVDKWVRSALTHWGLVYFWTWLIPDPICFTLFFPNLPSHVSFCLEVRIESVS